MTKQKDPYLLIWKVNGVRKSLISQCVNQTEASNKAYIKWQEDILEDAKSSMDCEAIPINMPLGQ